MRYLRKAIPVLLVLVMLVPAYAAAAAKVSPTIYGEYTLLKTLDINGNIKLPVNAVSSLTLRNDNSYELVFKDGSKSAGRMKTDISDLDDLGNREWLFELRDDRNDDEPSYNFAISAEKGGSICVLEIPQGVEDNSWLDDADFCILKR